jgi:hypothetical protein
MNALDRVATPILLVLPGAAVVFFSFNAGGFFPASVAFGTLLLVVALGLRLALAESPFDGFSVPIAVAASAFALFALWTLLSGRWGMHAPGRSLIEADRALLYLAALLLLGTVPRTSSNLRWMVRGVSLGIVAVCVTGLATRVLPNVFPTATTIASDRLSYPVTYWNALGLIAAVGIIFCFHHASSRSEPPVVRILGAAALPLLGTTLFFTFSRGAIAAGIAGLAIYVVLGRPRALLSGLLATAPAVVAVVVAYNADLLATDRPTTPAATHQGHRVALVVAACVVAAAVLRFALLQLDRRLPREGILHAVPRRAIVSAGVAAAALAIALVIAADVPSGVAHQYDRFVHNQGSGETGHDLRSRLTNPANNGRVDLWTAAYHAFTDKSVAGYGAGTFQNLWAAHRTTSLYVQDGHSLYMEVLSELGIVGVLLLLATLVTFLTVLMVRTLRGDRTVYAAIFATTLTWAIHAGVDWDWEMPATTIWVFALGGAALAASARSRPIRKPGTLLRTAAVIGCFGLGVLPGLVLASQTRLDDSADAFARKDCGTAVSAANDAISVLNVRPEPYEIRGYCRLRQGDSPAAVRDFQRAVQLDPGYWVYHYDLAVAKAAAGTSPAGEAILAYAYDRLDPQARDLARRLVTRNKRRWRREARVLMRDAGPFYLSTR